MPPTPAPLPNPDVRPTIVRLLSNMTGAREIELYLKRFSQLDRDRFAVVKVGGAVLRDDLAALVSSLAFLQQVGLTPIVIHGAGPQLDAEMKAAGLDKETREGLRITTPEVLKVVRRVMRRENLRLVEALQEEGVRATSLLTGVFDCELLDRDAFGLVGRVVGVDTEGLQAAVNADSIPVIASLGETAEGQIVNVNADWAANDLVKRIQPYKIIFLTGTGGLLDADGHLISSISLATQYEELMAQPWVHSGMRVKMEQIHDLLLSLPPSSSLSITSPDHLAKELFTHRGSGTLVRRGERILTFEGWDGIDRARFRGLVEASFGRPLVTDWFERTTPVRIYLSEGYRAAIVLTPVEIAGGAVSGADAADRATVTYMDKFVVDPDAQGEGLGRAIWDVMRRQTPRLFWRSRRTNHVNEFYFNRADGSWKDPTWTVFWYGMEAWGRVRGAVEHALARPATVLPDAPSGP
jgi:acetylglutamate kinase